MEKEITFELTNYCEHSCEYCSSETTSNISDATFLSILEVQKHLNDKHFERIILSGGEPLSHPYFYDIFCMCRNHSKDVIVYTNLIRHIAYNANVHDGIYVEVALNIPPETSKVRILKRVMQGRESKRPEVSISRNFTEDCNCKHTVIKSNGDIAKSPCAKERQ